LNVRATLYVALLGRFQTCPYISFAAVARLDFGVFGGCLTINYENKGVCKMKAVSQRTARPLCAAVLAAAILSMFMAGAAFGDENEDPWYEIAVGVTGVFQGTPGAASADIDGTFKPSMSFDAELTLQTPKSGTVYLMFESGEGEGIDAHIPTFSGFNDDADDNFNLRPSEAWYEHAFGEKARLRGGKIDLTTDFDTNAAANDETGQFLSGGFVNNPAVEFPDDNSLGAMLWASPNDLLDIGFGFADAAADWDNVFQNPFFILEFDLKPKISGRQGNYRFYGWHNGKDHERFDSLDEEATLYTSNYGFGISADQEIAEGVTLFARYGRQRGVVSETGQAWSAGLDISGRFMRRGEDSFGLAYGQALAGKDWKSLAQETGADFGNEHHLEIYYRIRAGRFLDLSPNLQWVRNPVGDRVISGAWAFGVRAQFNLSSLDWR
jgi:hypothetical protein